MCDDGLKVNPGSVILSGEMMLRHLGWEKAADLVIKGMDGAIGGAQLTVAVVVIIIAMMMCMLPLLMRCFVSLSRS